MINRDYVWNAFSRTDRGKDEIADNIVQLNLDSLILVMTATQQLHLWEQMNYIFHKSR